MIILKKNNLIKLTNQKIKFLIGNDQIREGLKPLFFYFYKKNVIINLFFDYRLLKEHNFDVFTIAFKYIIGKFNLGIKR